MGQWESSVCEISTAGKKKYILVKKFPPVSTAEVHINTARRNGTTHEEVQREKKDMGIKDWRTDAMRNKGAQIAFRDAGDCRQWKMKIEEKKKVHGWMLSLQRRLTGMNPSVLRISSLKMKHKSSEKIVEEEAVAQKEREEVVKEPATKRKKSIPRKTTRKRQKLEEDADKDELKRFLDIVPREEAPIEIESLSTKFPIVDWKTVVLTETFMLVMERDTVLPAPEGF
ncbi:hypothetical protein Tco_1327500 [Tanacetum coccineum]